MAMRLENGCMSTSKNVKALADMFERLAANSEPINQFNFQRCVDINKTNGNGIASTEDARIGLGRTCNETEIDTSSKESSCHFIAHERGECRCKDKNAEEILQNLSFSIETALDYNGVRNVNPRRLSHRNQISERRNRKEITNSFRDGSLECNPTILNLVDELISTEQTYITDLNYIIKEYLNYFPQHHIRAKFGHIEAIFEHSQHFYTDLCSCKYDLQKIAETFLTYDVLFEIYVQYIRNHRRYVSYLRGTYEKAIQDRTKALNDPFNMESHLLKPYQRLTRHRLLLQNIQKASETLEKTNETIGQAVVYLDSKLNRANTLVAVDTIKNCPFDLTNKGTLLLQNKFTTKRRIKTQEVFLFEDIIVFTEPHEEQKDAFCYTSCIAMNCIYSIPTSNYDTIVLTFKSLNGKQVESIEIETSNEAIRRRWITIINQLLFTQLEQAKVDRQKSPSTNVQIFITNLSSYINNES